MGYIEEVTGSTAAIARLHCISPAFVVWKEEKPRKVASGVVAVRKSHGSLRRGISSQHTPRLPSCEGDPEECCPGRSMIKGRGCRQGE